MLFIFYNTFSNGDYFMSRSLVKSISEQNKDHQFKIFTNFNSYLFRDIENLEYMTDPMIPFGHPEKYNLYLFFRQFDKEPYIRLNKDVILINTCCSGLNAFIGRNAECDVIALGEAMKRCLSFIESREKILLQFNYTLTDLLPSLPSTDISSFLEWKKDKSNLVFYYNYLSKTGAKLPIVPKSEHDYDDHDEVVLRLSNTFPEKTFLLPRVTPALKDRPNIVSCEELFDCPELPSCENLCKLIRIANLCDVSIHFDIGACFYYLHSQIFEGTNKIIHVGVTSMYYDLLYKSLLEMGFPKEKIDSKMIYMQCLTTTELYTNLTNDFSTAPRRHYRYKDTLDSQDHT